MPKVAMQAMRPPAPPPCSTNRRRPCPPAPCTRPQRNRLQLQLEEVEGQLREARAARKESERDRRVNEAVAGLKAQYRDRACALVLGFGRGWGWMRLRGQCRTVRACSALLARVASVDSRSRRCHSPAPVAAQACTGAWPAWRTCGTSGTCWR